jgi:glycosyltransferase involved in cell wall biosynthesis
MHGHRPRVSVLVSVYNAGRYVEMLRESLEVQSFREYEVVIYDDGSTDGSAEGLRSIRCMGGVRFHSGGVNRGVGYATRWLLHQVRGQYWSMPGADDLLDPSFLAVRVAALERDEQALFAHGRPHFLDSAGGDLGPIHPTFDLPASMASNAALECLLEHNFVNTTSVMGRTAALECILNRCNERWQYAQDWALWMLLACQKGTVLYDSDVRSAYRVHTGSVTGRKDLSAVRQAETRLVPLCSLSEGRYLSPDAGRLWNLWKGDLYGLWLRRALVLAVKGRLRLDWLREGEMAYRGRGLTVLSPARWMCGAGGVLSACLRDIGGAKRRAFQPSGMAALRNLRVVR